MSFASWDALHLFFDCPHAIFLIFSIETFLSKMLKKPTSLLQNTLLYNFSKLSGNPNIILIKIAFSI